MNLSSVTSGQPTREKVRTVMTEKPLDVIITQLTTQWMKHMTEQISKMVASVETTAWGGLCGYLSIVLDDVKYKRVTTDSQLDSSSK